MCDQLLPPGIKGLNDINLSSLETVFVCYAYTKSNTAFHVFKLYKWYQIAQIRVSLMIQSLEIPKIKTNF